MTRFYDQDGFLTDEGTTLSGEIRDFAKFLIDKAELVNGMEVHELRHLFVEESDLPFVGAYLDVVESRRNA